MKKHRMYSLFERRDGKWVRLSPLATKKDAAVRLWQTALLATAFGGPERSLRVVDDQR